METIAGARLPLVDVEVDAGRVRRALLIAVGLLCVLSLLGQVSRYYLDHGNVFGLVRLFHVAREQNVPTWFSSCLLFACAALLAVISLVHARTADRHTRHWLGLALGFAYLSLDETAVIHEGMSDRVHALTGTASGFLRYAWVVPGSIGVCALLLAYRGFLRALDRQTARRFVLAGALYIGGAIGLEVLSGRHAETFGEDNFGYSLWTTAEEALEMLGAVVLLHALLEHLGSVAGGIGFRVAPSGG